MPSRVDSRRKLGREARIRRVNILGYREIGVASVTYVGCIATCLNLMDRCSFATFYRWECCVD